MSCWRMNMLVTSQYQPRLSSITNVAPGESHQIKLYKNNSITSVLYPFDMMIVNNI